MTDFTNIEYLKLGNKRQQLAFKELSDLKIFALLKEYKPLLAGTIPIGIDLPNSDIDIICQCKDHLKFRDFVSSNFGHQKAFHLKTKLRNKVETSIASFKATHFIIEIFAQNIASEKQNAFRHMLIEHRIMENKGISFKNKIIALKQSGYKTEPAFAKLLGLDGDPYKALLELE